jgi:hypothetical protein
MEYQKDYINSGNHFFCVQPTLKMLFWQRSIVAITFIYKFIYF